MKTVPMFTRSLFSLLATCLIALSACATAGGSSTADNSALMDSYQDYKAAWNRHDVSELVGYFGQDGTLNNPNAGGPVSGEALAGWLQATFAAIPDFKVQVLSASPIGNDRIADQWVIKGTWTKPFPGGPLAGAKPTGKSFAVPGAGFYEWEDGKIVSGTHYFDQMALLTQMGVIPPPGQNPEASVR